MLEKYGFLCDCPACSMTGVERKRDNEQRRLLHTLDGMVERHLYDIEDVPMDENDDLDAINEIMEKTDISITEPNHILQEELEDLKDVLFAIKLLLLKLHLMHLLGFKIVSQVSQCHSLCYNHDNNYILPLDYSLQIYSGDL